VAPLELLAGYLVTNQAGETQDRFIEPSADRRACRLLWGRSGQFGPSPLVPCRHASMSLAKSDFRYGNGSGWRRKAGSNVRAEFG